MGMEVGRLVGWGEMAEGHENFELGGRGKREIWANGTGGARMHGEVTAAASWRCWTRDRRLGSTPPLWLCDRWWVWVRLDALMVARCTVWLLDLSLNGGPMFSMDPTWQ